MNEREIWAASERLDLLFSASHPNSKAPTNSHLRSLTSDFMNYITCSDVISDRQAQEIGRAILGVYRVVTSIESLYGKPMTPTSQITRSSTKLSGYSTIPSAISRDLNSRYSQQLTLRFMRKRESHLSQKWPKMPRRRQTYACQTYAIWNARICLPHLCRGCFCRDARKAPGGG